MAKLSAVQVAAAAQLGGFPAQAIPTAVAVAYGESNFNTTSSNACCTGLWQVHRTAHADKIAKAGGLSKLTDPVVNASIARQIWAGDWCGSRAPNGHCAKYEAYGLNNAGKTWAQKLQLGAQAYQQLQAETSKGKTPQQILGTTGSFADGLGLTGGLPGQVAGAAGGVGGVVDAAGAIAGTGRAVVDVANRIGRWVGDPQSWFRVMEVLGGALLVAIGLRITFNNQVNAAASKVIGAVVPGGKAGAMAAAKGATGLGRK